MEMARKLIEEFRTAASLSDRGAGAGAVG